jgi:membrane-bound metal-dependent hydrolase YbcI (DUF457 family)
MTPAGHLLSGYLVGAWATAGRSGADRWILMGLALAGSLAPDADVALGLAGGWDGAGIHRGATHSAAAALAAGLVAAAAFARFRRAAFLAAAGGVGTHIFWDALNVWGVQLLWPADWYLRGNVLHERDFHPLLIVAAASVLTWRARRRAAVVWLALSLPAYVAFQANWGRHARRLAETKLPGRRVEVFPMGRLHCGWIAVSAGPADLAVHCAQSLWSEQLRPMRQVPLREDFFTRASQRSPSVQEFLRKIPFPYAEERAAPDGGALVIWRDLREAFEQGADGVPTGIHVLVSPQGAILNERHQWWLKLW